MRTTIQRKIIIETLQKHKDHPGAEEIYTEVRSVLPKISLGTVYRNLDMLAGNGVISRLDVGGSHAHYDPEPASHPHFHCKECGSVSDLDWEETFDVSHAVQKNSLNNFSTESVEILVRGVCPSCRTS